MCSYQSINFVLVTLALGFRHDQSMIEQKHLEIAGINLRTATLVESAFIHKLSALIGKSKILILFNIFYFDANRLMTHYCFARLETQLRIKL